MVQWAGLPVRKISFEGVSEERLVTLRGHLPQGEGQPLDTDKVADSLRALFATGLFDSVEAVGTREGDGVAIVFRGAPRMFIGTVSVDGAKGATVNTQLERGSRLNPGTRFTEAKIKTALDVMRQVLAQNGFNEPAIHYDATPHPADQLTDIAFHVNSGVQSRVGKVTVTGESGMTAEEFQRLGRLRAGAKVNRETVSRALAGVLKHYRKQNRLEAEIKLESQKYAGHRVDYGFTATQGPVVKVVVEGASLDKGDIQRLIPIFQEGTVDDDLLNEGNRKLRDYFQSLGYFDVKVDHVTSKPSAGEVLIAYDVNLGAREHVERVSMDGNHYFDSATLKEILSVRAADTLDRRGAYSQALVSADEAALEGLYRNNGFSNVKVTAETSLKQNGETGASGASAQGAAEPLTVVYHIVEGQQERVGSVRLEGNEHVDAATLTPLMNTEAGQLLSPRNLAGDRDALVTHYMSLGFENPLIEVEEKQEANDATKTDVVFRIAEGKQVFVRNVLVTGLHYTRPQTVQPAITIRAGDPLSQTALEETQKNLYEYALFNEVNLAVQNPNGDEAYKTVLLQAIEARRWTFTYGGGFEVQTGTPVNGCQGLQASGVKCTPSGKTGISPRLLLALTRNNLFGREQSASVQGTYGLLEQKVDLIYQNPRFAGSRNFGFTFTGGYANSLDVTTYVASRLEAGFRLTQTYNRPGSTGLFRANTFIYAFDFRRVKVAEESLQVFPQFVPVLSTAVRVGGPSITWVRDTRDNPVDAHRGTYTSFQEFLSSGVFAAQASFNRLDTTNSSYYGWDKDKWVLARNTRYGQERAFGSDESRLLPLPERLYAGGATSLRGYSINAAGPRDPDTGFPIGGAAAFVNSTELRLPPVPLPYFGNALSFVVFHDMGNVFNNSRDVWPSLLRFSQPDRDACKTLSPPQGNPPTLPYPSGPPYSTGPSGACSFNYFSQTPGLGLRYHTPVGPIRLDFSYNLNPPIFPVNVDYSKAEPFSDQHVGEASHFNFFFSLGQTF